MSMEARSRLFMKCLQHLKVNHPNFPWYLFCSFFKSVVEFGSCGTISEFLTQYLVRVIALQITNQVALKINEMFLELYVFTKKFSFLLRVQQNMKYQIEPIDLQKCEESVLLRYVYKKQIQNDQPNIPS